MMNTSEGKKKKKKSRSTTPSSTATPEKKEKRKDKRSKSSTPRKGRTLASGGGGKYRDKSTDEETLKSPRSVTSKTCRTPPRRQAKSPPEFSLKTPPIRTLSSKTSPSPKRGSDQSPADQRRVRNKLSHLCLKSNSASGSTGASKKKEEEGSGVEKPGKPAPNTIEWQCTKAIGKALTHFFDEGEWVELPHDEKVEMLAGCYTPSELKPVYLLYMTLTGVNFQNVNLGDIKSRKGISKAMTDVIVKVMNMSAELGSTG